MFGYVIANEKDLLPIEKDRYQQVYCGLCRELGQRHGQLSRLCLNYDMTFLILLSSLYEPEDENGETRCVVHPVGRHPYSDNRYTQYAADMTVALSYYKCLDDWKDDHKLSGRCFSGILKNAYSDVKARCPWQCAVIEACMQEFTRIEQGNGGPDEAANCFGRLMGELFVYEDDVWAKPLRQFGNCLGRFIYIMDAVIDYGDDKKHGSYNPILAAGKEPEGLQEAMTIQIGMASEIFEKLPLVEDAHLLRSIIYAGVWQKYQIKMEKLRKEEYHPDLHPNDPVATQKMAEVNEAYDMLMNPEKYAKYQQQTQRNQGYGQESYSQGQGRASGGYQGPGGWSSDFGGFDFSDIFGFGFGEASEIPDPQVQAGDSPEIQQAVNAIRSRQYQSAINILNRVVSYGRNGRWYYLSALANNGAGYTVMALEQIQKVVQMEPDNRDYQRVLQHFQQTSQTYQQASRGYTMDPSGMGKCCMGMCLANLLCRFCIFGC